MRTTSLLTLIMLAFAGLAPSASAAPVRVKELVDVQGVRDNALYGYGLVVGLAGSGDSQIGTFNSHDIARIRVRLGIRNDPATTRVRNPATVIVLAGLPSFPRPGTLVHVNVVPM